MRWTLVGKGTFPMVVCLVTDREDGGHPWRQEAYGVLWLAEFGSGANSASRALGLCGA